MDNQRRKSSSFEEEEVVANSLGKKKISRAVYVKIGAHLQCQKCGMKFNTKSQLKTHFLSHKDKSTWPFECQLCEEKAQSKFNLNRHYMTKIHRDDPRFEQ